MSIRSSGRLFDRLRRSTRLAALVLLVFAMKLASTTACVAHDYASIGGADDHAAVVQAANVGDHAAPALPSAVVCTDCGCHQASALPTPLAIAPDAPARDRVAYRPPPPPPAAPSETLRPPIV